MGETESTGGVLIQDQAESSNWMKWIGIVALVYLLLLAVSLIGNGFKLAAGNQATELFQFASNPITGLVIGIVATALIQSSSTVTSIIVGLVAGGLPVGLAIPMVMGANIGTTVTNTIVSLGHIKKTGEFRRAFAAATVHDFFNLLNVIIFLPLEIMFEILEKSGSILASYLVGGESVSVKSYNFIKPLIGPPVDFIQGYTTGLSDVAAGVLLVVLGVIFIFTSITMIGKLLKVLMVGRAKEMLRSAVGRGPLSGITSGAITTILVQSSSTTTSLIVPLAGNGIFTLRQVYPFTLGANIGTCITGLLAATAIVGANAVFALQIALVHLLYNIFGVILIYGTPFLRELPIFAAEKLAALTVVNKLYAAVYLFGAFFIVPGLLISASRLFGV
jgi:solute carrier family 34 (sodium-dependent phosphate cotransporter)